MWLSSLHKIQRSDTPQCKDKTDRFVCLMQCTDTIPLDKGRGVLYRIYPNQILYFTSHRQVEYNICEGCKSYTPWGVLVLWFYPILWLAASKQPSQSATLLQISIVVHHAMNIHSVCCILDLSSRDSNCQNDIQLLLQQFEKISLFGATIRC